MSKRKGSGCGCLITVLLFNLILGGVSFDYCLWYIFDKNIPWVADIVCGFILAELTVPLMLAVRYPLASIANACPDASLISTLWNALVN